MALIVINGNSTADDLKEFERIFSKISSPDLVRQAEVNYRFPIPAPDANPLTFPLIICTDDDLVFCIRNVTAGYGGEGPHATCRILEMCGFEFNRKRILADSHGEPVIDSFMK